LRSDVITLFQGGDVRILVDEEVVCTGRWVADDYPGRFRRVLAGRRRTRLGSATTT